MQFLLVMTNMILRWKLSVLVTGSLETGTTDVIFPKKIWKHFLKSRK